jgi:hypothetical protein
VQVSDSKEYYQRRAEEERAAAERAGDERAAKSHRELAERFDDLANGGAAAQGSGPPNQRPGILPPEFRILP